MSSDIHVASGSPGVGDSVAIHGRITIATSEQMRRMLSDALRAKPTNVSVDLSDVSYIDTSGLATLVEAFWTANKQATRLVLVGIQGQPQFLLKITRLDRLFGIAR